MSATGPPERLLELLACPRCRARLEESAGRLVCSGCGTGYPVRAGVAILLVESGDAPLTRPSSQKR